MSGYPGPIPKRWLNCPRKSLTLIGNKFLAFKTPLSSAYDDQVPGANRFDVNMLFHSCKSMKIRLGLWIDLTNTSRFYDQAEVIKRGCKYIKLECRGHGEAPSVEQTGLFLKLVQNFISKNPLECIAVHCTHGFNRTGFLLCSYLIKHEDFEVESALDKFAEARPPGIYKADYIKELYDRYNFGEDVTLPPPLPDWCFEEEEEDDDPSGVDDNSEDYTQKNQSANFKGKGKRRKSGKVAKFMEGVPGVFEYTKHPEVSKLISRVQKMCRFNGRDFPGAQPVSMDRENIQLLHEKPYRVSWKADGTRYMMLIDGEKQIYFIDRDNNIFYVEKLRFPKRKELQAHLEQTLLDGEMVIDKLDDKIFPRYLVYDIIHFDGVNIAEKPFYKTRLQYIEFEIIKPRYAAMECGIINKQSEPFSVRNKEFWDINQAGNLLGEKFAASLLHEPDGLIFQPSLDPYRAGRCDHVLKWKPPHMNSVDFKLKIVVEGGMGKIPSKKGILCVGHCDTPFGTIKITNELKEMDGKIVECMFDGCNWKFMRQRVDKSFPNSENTALAVFNSIKYPVTEEALLSFIRTRGYKETPVIMGPPTKIRKL